MRQEKRTSRITGRYTTKGVQFLNGDLWFTDFPFKRPVYYHLELANGDTIESDEDSYNEYCVGDVITYTAAIWEKNDTILLLIGVAVIALLSFLLYVVFFL